MIDAAAAAVAANGAVEAPLAPKDCTLAMRDVGMAPVAEVEDLCG